MKKNWMLMTKVVIKQLVRHTGDWEQFDQLCCINYAYSIFIRLYNQHHHHQFFLYFDIILFSFRWYMRQEEKRDKCQVNLSSEHRYIISINRARLPPQNYCLFISTFPKLPLCKADLLKVFFCYKKCIQSIVISFL